MWRISMAQKNYDKKLYANVKYGVCAEECMERENVCVRRNYEIAKMKNLGCICIREHMEMVCVQSDENSIKSKWPL